MPSQEMTKPRALRKGSTIGVIAPASNLKAEMLDAGLAELESLGFKTRVAEGILDLDRYTAGPVSQRAEALRSMLLDDDVHAIFCARGGYGSGHVLPYIDRAEIRAHPKIFCGSSDVTMLLAAFESAGLVAFHGPMIATSIRQGEAAYDRDLLIRMLVGAETIQFPTEGCSVLHSGRAEGRLTGGCLSLLVSTLGTPWEIDTTDAILVLEDADCRPYQVDRMLTHLRQAGKFASVRGFIVGEMPGCVQHPEQGYTIADVIGDALEDLKVPVLFGFPTGHTSKPNVIVPFGINARLSIENTLSFELLEPAVEG